MPGRGVPVPRINPMTVIETEGLTVTASDGTTLLRDVDVAAGRGETALLCGRPGSGKTLLAKAIHGVLGERDDLRVSGTVRREGSVGFVFQNPAVQLVRRGVRSDVAFGLENAGLPVEEIRERIDRYADFLDAGHLLDRGIHDLSAGETAKVAVLGCLVTEPDVIVLDEPLATLDYPSSRLLLDAIDRLRESGATVIIAEHDLRDLLGRADTVFLLREGEVIRRGSPEELARALCAEGVKLPFPTELAVELGRRTVRPPADEGVDRP